MKSRELIPNQVSFLANNFVANHVAQVQSEAPNGYNDLMNAAIQRIARAQAVDHFSRLMLEFIQKELEAGHRTRIQFYDTMDFRLDPNEVHFVPREHITYFNRQDGKCEAKPKDWKAWNEIRTKVLRRCNGHIVTYKEDEFRIVKRRDTLFLTKLED
ncbi:hypothetical protein D3C85_951940 [compost metagenome]